MGGPQPLHRYNRTVLTTPIIFFKPRNDYWHTSSCIWIRLLEHRMCIIYTKNGRNGYEGEQFRGWGLYCFFSLPPSLPACVRASVRACVLFLFCFVVFFWGGILRTALSIIKCHKCAQANYSVMVETAHWLFQIGVSWTNGKIVRTAYQHFAYDHKQTWKMCAKRLDSWIRYSLLQMWNKLCIITEVRRLVCSIDRKNYSVIFDKKINSFSNIEVA